MALDVLLLPLLPCAVWWVRRRESDILRVGEPLNTTQLALARAIGVIAPERVRVMTAVRVPMPLPDMARRMAEWLGLLSPNIAGITLGHGIVFRDDCCDDCQLLAHEFMHVAQYERYACDGGYAGFLRRYLRECVWSGYPRGPLEVEARSAEAIAAHYSRSTGENVIPYAPDYCSDAPICRENPCS